MGTIVTAIVQSSTATTVMAVSLVQGGVLSFRNSLGIIFGANIGTTFTTHLIAFDLLELAPFILLFGYILSKVGTKFQYLGKPFFYFGLLFSSLFIISVLVEPLKSDPLIIDLLAKSSGVFASILIGIALCALFQASSVVSAMAVILAGTGLIGFVQAFSIILGANIGTTTTALIASSVMDKQARRAAMAHLMFNVIGVILIIPFINEFIAFVSTFSHTLEIQVSLAQMIFNILSAILALIFIKQFEKLITFIVK
jgi:phosphate:Na+ symporter